MNVKSFHHAKKVSRKPVVLVAGGAGFIGSYLCELLLLKNCQVIVADNFLTGRKENLKNCFEHPNFIFIKHDLTNPFKEIDEADYIFYLAGLEAYIKGITNLLKLAKNTEAKFLLARQNLENLDGLASFAGAKGSAEDMVIRSHQRGEVDARIVHLSFIYGPRMNLEAEGELRPKDDQPLAGASLIKDAISGGPLRVPGDGSRKIYPTFIADIVYGLSKAMFSSGTGGKIFSLVNPGAVTLLGFAQELKKQSQKPLTIEFVPEAHLHTKTTSGEHLRGVPSLISDHLGDEARKSQADLGWKAKVEIKEGIKQTLKYFEKEVRKAKPTPLPQPPLAASRWATQLTTYFPRLTTKTKVIATVIFLSLFILTYPFSSLLFDSFWGVSNLQGAQQALFEVDFPRATKKARRAQQAFSRANQKIHRFSFLFPLFRQEKLGVRVEKLFAVGGKVGESVVHAGLAAQSATQLGKIIFQDQPGDIETLLSDIKIELDFAYNQLSLAEAEVKTEKDLLPIKIPFTEIRSLLLKAREGVEVVPEVIGAEGRRAYLVLLQNNMELRPTGGFIGSYALVTFAEGKLIDFEVEDVYTADGQLKGHVEPPPELKKYLGEAGWYLRDSNWSPDFPTSALRAEWFLEKETGRTVDGVIGVDLFLAQNILEQIGEVEVPDFQEKINHQNLFERAEYHSEAGFFPGSTQKRDFLASLTRTLFEKIKSSGEKSWFSLGKAIYHSLKEKDLLVYLHNPEAMGVISNLGWDGRIKNVKCQMSNVKCVVDYLMIVEANVGVNKANYFLQRNLTHQVEIDQEGIIKERLQIQYQNQSQSETFPAGRYKNYIRVYVPLKSELVKLVVKDPQTGRSEEIGSEKWEIKEEYGKTVFGFLVEVPIKEQRIVELSYQLAEKIDLARPTQYLLLLQKQPGIRDKAFNFWLTAPAGASLLEARPSAAQSGNTLVFNPEFNQDIVFEVGLVEF